MESFLESKSLEAEIIAGLRAGGRDRRNAENKLFEYFFKFIKQGVSKYELSEEDAASAYGDSIISVIKNIVTYQFEERASLKTYTYQIFLNKCVDIVRKETTNKSKVHQTTAINDFLDILPDNAKTIVQKIIEKNQLSIVLKKLEEIGDKCKQLLLLFEDGYSDREIAERMLYNSTDNVKTNRLRCLERLKKSCQQ